VAIKRTKTLLNKSSDRLGLVLIIIGIIGIVLSFMINANQPKPPKIAKGVAVQAAPSSVKPAPETVAAYNVPPSDPKYIAIPAINIANTPVLKLGLLKSGAIATPDNIYDTGWYDGSSLPGQSGAMFIYGHVSSWTANGIFYNLKKLAAGDKIIITRGDNTVYNYQVISSEIYPYNNVNMSQVLAPVNSQPGLNLMTCTGQVIKGTSEFNERLVVFTSLVTAS
jgi:LPXTG-site transpeptidase (sortase) family protein